MRAAYGVAWIALLTACGASSAPDRMTPDRAALAAGAAQRLPADTELADLYTHACRNYHANAASGGLESNPLIPRSASGPAPRKRCSQLCASRRHPCATSAPRVGHRAWPFSAGLASGHGGRALLRDGRAGRGCCFEIQLPIRRS